MQDSNDDDRGAVSPYETLIAPVMRGWRFVVAGVTLGALVGGFLGFNQVNVYQSTAKLLVRAGAREESTPESRLVGSDRSPVMSPREAVLNELHLLGDPLVFQEVARRITPKRILGPYDPAALDDEWTSTPTRLLHRAQSWWFGSRASDAAVGHPLDDCSRCVQLAAKVLEDGLHRQAESGSSVITLDYTASSPDLARDVLDTYSKVAIEHHQTVFATDTSLEFLNTQVQQALASASEADDALTEHRITCGVFDIETRRSGLLTAIYEAEDKTRDDGARLAELRAQTSMLAEELAKEPAKTTQVVERPPIANPNHLWLRQQIQELRTQVSELEGRLDLTAAELQARRQGLEKQLGELTTQLAAQPELVYPGSTTQELPSARHARLQERLDEARADLVALEAGAQGHNARLSELREELIRLEQCEPGLRTLESDAQQQRARATQLITSRDRTAVMNLLDSVNLTNLRLLQVPNLPGTKSGPSRGKLLAIGTLLGLGLGALVALLRRALDPRVRHPSDVLAWAGHGGVFVVPRAARSPRKVALFRRRAAL
ncbi:MAG: hypothetical protein IPJ77_05565 [Planctomycetes bacterium]|nr:hypothetical protein [Planctomycetota bacterium]